jgi:hypothetical protein
MYSGLVKEAYYWVLFFLGGGGGDNYIYIGPIKKEIKCYI